MRGLGRYLANTTLALNRGLSLGPPTTTFQEILEVSQETATQFRYPSLALTFGWRVAHGERR